MIVQVTIALLFFGLLIGLPITFALIVSGALGLWMVAGINTVIGIVGTAPSTAVSHYELITIPMFILMAEFMIVSRVADDTFLLIGRAVRRLPGGLAIATAITGAAFGAISGSSTAAAATLSASSVPTMLRQGYDGRFAAGVVSISGTLAMLIPPSIALILYGLLAGESIAKLLIAGLVPGLLAMAAICLTVLVLIRIDPSVAPDTSADDTPPPVSPAAALFLVLFLSVTGSIYLGIATPTEASALGALGAMLIAAGRRRLTPDDFGTAVVRAVISTTMIMAIFVGAEVFGYFVTLTRFPTLLVDWVLVNELSPALVLFVVILIYLALGMFLDQIAILILTVPVFLPLMTSLGYDPIWFGVLIVVLAEIGLVSPPLGLNVFVVSRYSGVPVTDAFRGVFPHIVAHLVVIGLLVAIPELATWLPSTM